MCEIKDRIAEIVNNERKFKNIKLNDLDRCLHSFGFKNYPIIRVLNRTIPSENISMEYYLCMLIICGIDVSLIFTDLNHSKRNVKNRQKLMDLFTDKNN